MNPEPLGMIPVVMVMISTLAILWHLKWKWVFGILIFQYLALFLFFLQTSVVVLALIRGIVGLVCSAVLSSSLSYQQSTREDSERSGQVFRSLVAIFLWVMIFFAVPSLQVWLRFNTTLITGSFVLFGIGLLQLGMTNHPVYVAIGLLTVLSGFELLYSALEVSVLLTGLFAGVSLGIALVGAYLAALSTSEDAI